MSGLAALLQQLRETLQEPVKLEPEVDQKELGVDDAAKFRCAQGRAGTCPSKGLVNPRTFKQEARSYSSKRAPAPERSSWRRAAGWQQQLKASSDSPTTRAAGRRKICDAGRC